MTDQHNYDVVIVGAGVCGIYALYRMRELGVRVTVLEAGDDLGGTWYWNRYPGARFDSESYSYGYSFSKELLEEWNWTEQFSPQPETLKYLNYVADKFELRDFMQFGCRVVEARFHESPTHWSIELEDGRILRTKFLLTAIGMLSAATLPTIEGREEFQGESFHTYYWPKEPVSLKNKRVGVIGTGATAVQLIPEVAKEASQLVVFQRRPNWCAPLHNARIKPETMTEIKASYDRIFARCARTPGGFIHGPDRREYDDLSKEEKLAFWEHLYDSPGFGKWLANFVKVLLDPEANAEYSDFIADKIRQRVKDPELAEKLIPKDHGFGTRRVPLETHYYESFNQDNVQLVDLNETPIERITRRGIQTTDQEYEFDIIVYATGFDAITGAFDRIQIRGRNGQTLKEKWEEGPSTYLGLQTSGFPNLAILAGPQSASVGTNFPRGIEEAVDWVTGLLKYAFDQNLDLIEASQEAETEWTELVKDSYNMLLLKDVKSWFTGYNSNVEGHDTTRYLVYFGGAPDYRQRLTDIAANDYKGFLFK